MPSLSSSDFRWLNYAMDQAVTAPHSQWRVGAVIVRGGSVLSTGVNRYRNHPSKVMSLDGVSYHAEEVAIRRAGDVAGSKIYVARVTRSGYVGMAMPCERCQEMLNDYGIHTAVWTTPTGWGKMRVREMVAAA
jgi:cytidine deaminase